MTDQAVDTGGIEVPQQEQRAAAGDVPASSTGRQFLGRTQELRELRADVERAGLNTLAGRKAPRPRVLLIAGRPGSGRTALAEEFVGQITLSSDRYPDGVLRARLAEPDGTPVPTARVARGLLGALRLPAPPGADEDDLTAMLRDALTTRRAVLLLDGAARAEQVDPLLPDAPDSLVVAVSKGPLTGIPDVRPCTLGGLDTPSAVRLLSRFTGSVRITCDPRSAEQLAEECGRMPAALRLAGGWLGARPRVSVADLAGRLRETVPGGDGSPLARVLAFAYADLPGPTARILRLLSHAPAGLADPQTASALAGCSVTAAHAALHDLAGLGLLRQVRADDASLPQYAVPDCLLPLLRALTTTQDRPSELQLARARMLERHVTLLQSCRAVTEPDGSLARRKLAELPSSLRFSSRTAAGRWLAVRQPVLLAAARTAVADGDLDTLARRLMAALVRALAAHYGTEAAAGELYGLHELVLEVAVRRGLHREEAAALLNLADLDVRAGRTRAALARYRAALDAARKGGDLYATGRAMESIGGAYQELADWPRAADWFGRALAQCLAHDERTEAARLYGRIAGAQTEEGHHTEALRSWRAAVAGYRKAGDVAGQARALSELARTQEYAGRYEESLRTCREAVERALHAHDEQLMAALELRLADLYERLDDPVAAGLHRTAAERLLGPAAVVSGAGSGGGAQALDGAGLERGAAGGPHGSPSGAADGAGGTRPAAGPQGAACGPAVVEPDGPVSGAPGPAARTPDAPVRRVPVPALAADPEVPAPAVSGAQGASCGGGAHDPERACDAASPDTPPSAYESCGPSATG